MKRLFATLAILFLFAGPAQGADDQIHIVPGSNINLVARDANIPINILNPTDQDLEVVLVGQSASLRLEVLDTVSVMVPAGSSEIAELSVRAIANGPVEVKVWLESDGKKIGEDQIISVNVNYDVELFLLVSFGALVVALLVLGVIRTAMKLARRNK